MASDFSGKKYLVTGVGSGIGRALAIELAQSGAEVWGVSRTKSNLDSLSVRKEFQRQFYRRKLFRKSVLTFTQYLWI